MKTLVIGAAIVDMMMKIDRLPSSGEDLLCTEAKTVIGGCAYNVANMLRNLESPHDLCVPVGHGIYADQIKKELVRHGYRLIIEDPEEDNGYCLSLIEKNGERTFITVQGVENRFKNEWFDQIDLSQYDNIYIAGYQVCGKSGNIIANRIANWCSGANVPTIFFAPGPMITMIDPSVMEKFFHMHCILHLNEKEALDYTGESDVNAAIRVLYEKTKSLVIVTTGARGAAFFYGKTIEIVPAVKTTIVDTVGAGDSHIAAFIAGLSSGLEIREAIVQANRTAATVISISGPIIDAITFKEKMMLFKSIVL